jgi:hypothetical protein
MPGKSKRLEQPLEFVRSGFALGGPRFTRAIQAASRLGLNGLLSRLFGQF